MEQPMTSFKDYVSQRKDYVSQRSGETPVDEGVQGGMRGVATPGDKPINPRAVRY